MCIGRLEELGHGELLIGKERGLLTAERAWAWRATHRERRRPSGMGPLELGIAGRNSRALVLKAAAQDYHKTLQVGPACLVQLPFPKSCC